MIEKLCRFIPDKNKEFVIFDVGSRDCQQSIEFYNTFPNAKIYAFECNPNTLKICEENIIPYQDRITLIKGAVCNYDGNITFYPINQKKTITTWKDGNPGASSLFKSNGSYNVEKYVQDEITTNCHRLETIMKQYNIPRVDIIWMDLQGAELLALQGLGDELSKVQYIYTEVSHKPIYTGQVMFKELNNFMIENNYTILNRLSMSGWQEDAIYYKPGVTDTFDIVIPIGPNDREVIEEQITYTKKNVIGYRNIYLISYDPTIKIDGCITINENIFPFNRETVQNFHGELNRNGWYLQQLLKLYAGNVIPNILDKYLVIDSDTFFLKPTFFTFAGYCLYNYGVEYHKPYFEHMKRLDDGFVKVTNKSGICHHMMFETKYINEIINVVEKKHNKLFYNVFLETVTEKTGSGASEYELYFNYMLRYNLDKIKIRRLNWANVNKLNTQNKENFDYVSCHWHMR